MTDMLLAYTGRACSNRSEPSLRSLTELFASVIVDLDRAEVSTQIPHSK